MGAAELLARIRADGEARAQAVAAEQRAAVAAIEAARDHEVERLRREGEARARAAASRIVERARSRARLTGRNAVLAARWRVLARVVSEAERTVLASPEYDRLLAALVGRHCHVGSVVRLSADDSKRLSGRLGIEVGPPAAITGGVVIRQGREELGFVLRETLERACEQDAAELSRILFE